MKISTLLTSIILFIALISNSETKSQTLEDSLLIYYSWNGDSLDYSGNNYTPDFFRATFIEDKDGNPESAVYFNGISDYIALPNIDILKPQFPLSIAFWVKMDTLIPQQTVFFTNDFSEFGHSGVWMNLGSNEKLALSYGDGEGFYEFDRRTIFSKDTLKSHIWYFVTGVVHNDYSMKLFINGIENIGSSAGTGGVLNYIGEGGNIGRKDATNSYPPYHFRGSLDEFYYWNRALSCAEISSLYEQMLVSNKNSNNYKSSFEIYPNPTNNKLYIKSKTDEQLFFKIINQYGEIVNFGQTLKVINVKDLAKGFYIVQLTSIRTKESVNRKFIKQ